MTRPCEQCKRWHGFIERPNGRLLVLCSAFTESKPEAPSVAADCAEYDPIVSVEAAALKRCVAAWQEWRSILDGQSHHMAEDVAWGRLEAAFETAERELAK